MTSVGGTRLVVNRSDRRVGEVVWNDLRWLKPAHGGGAGGGGLSNVYQRPPYQRSIRAWKPACHSGHCRPRLDAAWLSGLGQR